jgi:type II secretion system protein C
MSGFSLSERQIFFLNLLVGLLIIPFVGLCISDVFRLRLASSILPEEEAVHQRAGQARVVHHPRTYYDVIARRDVFNLAPPPQPTAPPVVEENLPLRLIGTSQLSSGKPYAILENQMGVQSLYRVGDTVPDGGPLVQVDPDQAIIMHNGHRVAIKMEHATPTPGQPMVPPNVQHRGFGHGRQLHGRDPRGIHRMGKNHFRIDRQFVSGQLKDMAPLFTEIRATPNVMNGQSNGFLLTEIQPDSVFQQIGLQNGDLLSSVNGQHVGDPAKAIGLLQSLQKASLVTLEVIRNGAPVELFYNIN